MMSKITFMPTVMFIPMAVGTTLHFPNNISSQQHPAEL